MDKEIVSPSFQWLLLIGNLYRSHTLALPVNYPIIGTSQITPSWEQHEEGSKRGKQSKRGNHLVIRKYLESNTYCRWGNWRQWKEPIFKLEFPGSLKAASTIKRVLCTKESCQSHITSINKWRVLYLIEVLRWYMHLQVVNM